MVDRVEIISSEVGRDGYNHFARGGDGEECGNGKKRGGERGGKEKRDNRRRGRMLCFHVINLLSFHQHSSPL